MKNFNLVLEKLSTAIAKIMLWKEGFSNQMRNKHSIRFIRQIAYEQELYSKTYGLKGKVDSVCELEDPNGKHKIYALELKTGNIVTKAHDMQVMMYNLLMNEVYDKASDR